MTSQARKAENFKALHESGETFTIPNPWDVGSARMLEEAGFKALATTSSGFAWTLGRKDGEVSLQEKLDHCRALSNATQIPINADFENGFADTPGEVAANILKLAETGVAGGSIEDWSRTAMYDFDLAVERVAACAEAVAALDFPFQLTARAEGLLRQSDNLDGVIKRLQAFEAAGADVLYAPGLKTLDEVEIVLAAVGRPVNVLGVFLPAATLADYQRLGVARVSIGGALAGVAKKAASNAITQLAAGSFKWN